MASLSLTASHYKVSATGNDFLIVDLQNPTAFEDWEKAPLKQKSRAEWVRRWCQRHQGIGADGMVFLQPDANPEVDFGWDFYNADGSSAEMCGNAARAVALHSFHIHGKTELNFSTSAGVIRTELHSPEKIEVWMPSVQDCQWGLKTSKTNRVYDFVDSGVPHAVINLPHLDNRDQLRSLAAEIKGEARFLNAGTNVTFVAPVGPTVAHTITFERGVEDFTLSCGTGAVAAAMSLTRADEKSALDLIVPGGRLQVRWNLGRPHLLGPAQIVAVFRAVIQD